MADGLSLEARAGAKKQCKDDPTSFASAALTMNLLRRSDRPGTDVRIDLQEPFRESLAAAGDQS